LQCSGKKKGRAVSGLSSTAFSSEEKGNGAEKSPIQDEAHQPGKITAAQLKGKKKRMPADRVFKRKTVGRRRERLSLGESLGPGRAQKER